MTQRELQYTDYKLSTKLLPEAVTGAGVLGENQELLPKKKKKKGGYIPKRGYKGKGSIIYHIKCIFFKGSH